MAVTFGLKVNKRTVIGFQQISRINNGQSFIVNDLPICTII
jgi:hypothetical protein